MSCLAAVTLLAGCGKRNEFVPPPPPEVTIDFPVQKNVVDSIEFTGTVRPVASVDLRARVNGYLQKIAFEDGAQVQQGDLLFVIEPAPYQAALQAAEADVQKAKSSLQLASANLARTKELFDRKVLTRQEYDVKEAEKNSSEADVAAAEARLEQAKLTLGYTEVRSPLTGRIGRHLVDLGNLVQSEQTLLATIESIDPVHAYFYLSERELLRFKQMLRTNDLPDPETNPPVMYLGLADEDGFPHEGHLDYREPSVDPLTGTITRRAIFSNPNNALVPGLFARIKAPIGEPQQRLLVEQRAIGSDQRGDYLLVVNDKDVVEYHNVELGPLEGNARIILKGIGPKDRVIVNGLQRARPGSKVKPVQQTPAESGTPAASPASNGNDQKSANGNAAPASQLTSPSTEASSTTGPPDKQNGPASPVPPAAEAPAAEPEPAQNQPDSKETGEDESTGSAAAVVSPAVRLASGFVRIRQSGRHWDSTACGLAIDGEV